MRRKSNSAKAAPIKLGILRVRGDKLMLTLPDLSRKTL